MVYNHNTIYVLCSRYTQPSITAYYPDQSLHECYTLIIFHLDICYYFSAGGNSFIQQHIPPVENNSISPLAMLPVGLMYH